jgi:hypothetical protein
MIFSEVGLLIDPYIYDIDWNSGRWLGRRLRWLV